LLCAIDAGLEAVKYLVFRFVALPARDRCTVKRSDRINDGVCFIVGNVALLNGDVLHLFLKCARRHDVNERLLSTASRFGVRYRHFGGKDQRILYSESFLVATNGSFLGSELPSVE